MPKKILPRFPKYFSWFSLVELSPEICETLVEALCITPGQGDVEKTVIGVLTDVQRTLSLYRFISPHLDYPPTPTHFIGEFEAIADLAQRLRDRLEAISFTPYENRLLHARLPVRDSSTGASGLETRLQDQHDEFDIRMLFSQLISLGIRARICLQAELAESKRQPQPQQRPSRKALRVTVNDLRKIFRQYYRGEDEPRVQKGAISNLSPRENDELEFIRVALRSAGIRHPHKLRALFDATTESSRGNALSTAQYAQVWTNASDVLDGAKAPDSRSTDRGAAKTPGSKPPASRSKKSGRRKSPKQD